jgi:hypothetical protein
VKLGRLIAAILVGVAAIVASAGAAGAHEEVPGVTAVIDSITPALPDGVRVEARISVADQLLVSNSTSVDLIVVGEQGEPFLRIGPDGAFANLKSATWYRSNDPTGLVRPPDDVDPKAEPVWARASTEPAWGWFDHRLHRQRLTSAPAVVDKDTPVVLEEWSVPLRYGAAEHVVKGHRQYKFPGGTWQTVLKKAPDELTVLPFSGVVPALTVARKSTDGPTVVVLGEEDEPMLRLTAAGVEANEASPTWVFTSEATGGYVRTGAVGAKEPPRWARLTAGQATWLDRRGQVSQTAAEGHPGDKKRWLVPVLIGERRTSIDAETLWVDVGLPQRPDESEAAPWWRQWWAWAVAGLVILGVVGGRMWLTRPSTMGEQREP